MRFLSWLLVSLPFFWDGSTQEPQAIPKRELMLSVTADTTEVEFGKGFPITVVRVWNKALQPDRFRDDALAPLVLKPVDVTVREDELRIEETRRYSGYAFSREEIAVPAVPFRAMPRDRGEERIVSSAAFTLRVVSALDTDDSGAAELPSGPFPAPFPWQRWSRIGVAVLAGLSFVTWLFRRRSIRPAPPPARLPAHDRAMQRLAQLRERRPDGFEQTRAFYVEATEVLCEYLAQRFNLIRAGLTTEELFSDTTVTPRVPGHEMLGGIFSELDLAKFARHIPSEDERAGLLTALETFVAETTP